MSGQMGNERKTIQNLKLVKTDIENNLLFVKGAVPGPTGSILKITKSVKYS
jgi:large subunit ribosomal protein L3